MRKDPSNNSALFTTLSATLDALSTTLFVAIVSAALVYVAALRHKIDTSILLPSVKNHTPEEGFTANQFEKEVTR